MGAPSYDPATLAEYFRPLADGLWQDPIVGPLLRRWADTDRDLIEAVRDIDRSQIRDALGASPADRLRVASDLATSFARARRVG